MNDFNPQPGDWVTRPSFWFDRQGIMRCPACGSEVYGFKEGMICSARGCGWSEDHSELGLEADA